MFWQKYAFNNPVFGTGEKENRKEKKVYFGENYFKNKYIKDHSSTPKVNKDMVKKVNTDEDIITCNECRY